MVIPLMAYEPYLRSQEAKSIPHGNPGVLVQSSSSEPQASQLAVQIDLEKNEVQSAGLVNTSVQDFAWRPLSIVVKDRKTKKPLSILNDSSGMVKAGEMIAILGPSGSGKTTLLNAIAQRTAAISGTVGGETLVNGEVLGLHQISAFSTYVGQEDALIGSLTVRETMHFAARLSLPSTVSKAERKKRVEDLIASFGLQDQADTIVGTPIKKGLSGGQKKRLSVASRLVTDPSIIFLDEPTSGLDSTLSFEVMNYIRALAKRYQLIVIASIHQPSTSTFNLFDKLCLLTKGDTCYFGRLRDAEGYFARLGYSMPHGVNPAEFYLDLINTDAAKPGSDIYARVQDITSKWPQSQAASQLRREIEDIPKSGRIVLEPATRQRTRNPKPWTVPLVLLHRSWIKSYRDIVAYGIRAVMYLGLAILMGTVFLRLRSTQDNIQPFINAIFFGGAFMSFMAVAYVPAFLEDLHTFRNERSNGLVGPLSFSVANFIIGLPFLFGITLIFTAVEYFLTNFDQRTDAFFKFLLWLFLDLVAAESLVVLVSAIFPVFVVALAGTAFANGLWMCVDGFLVPTDTLNPFWKYVFHYIDYQAYVFQGMMVNQFANGLYSCSETSPGQYHCMYESPLAAYGKIPGTAVLQALAIGIGHDGEWIGYIFAIILGYRFLAYIVLLIRTQ